MVRRPLIFLISVIVIFFIGFVLFQKTNKPVSSSAINVSTSFYPLAEFAQKVGGDLVKVTNLIPPGVEPHAFEPTPDIISSVYQSDLFIYNGGGVDTWATKLAPSLKHVKTLRMGDVVTDLISTQEQSRGGAFDDHYWLSPKRAIQQVEAIRDIMIDLDYVHADYYKKNSENFVKELKNVDLMYKQGLAQCEIRTVVTSHTVLSYLANDYHFEQISITGLSPDEEPSAGTLATIAKEAEERRLKFVFFETLLSPRLSQTLAEELGVQTLVFNPLEGLTEEEQANGKTYLSIMEDNLNNLKTAMSCQ